MDNYPSWLMSEAGGDSWSRVGGYAPILKNSRGSATDPNAGIDVIHFVI